MPKVMLVVSATLNNVALLQPRDGNNINYFFKLKCECCGWKSEEALVSVNVHEGAGGRYNLYRKCEGCERPGHITMIPGHEAPLSVDNSEEVGLMVFNCDGLLPTDYGFNGGWLATTMLGTKIYIDLGGHEGFKDVIDGMEVSITDLKGKFVPFRG